jgi:hypothetical protein
MPTQSQSSLLKVLLSSWNWKCAMMSATARSLVYLAAVARGGGHGAMAIVLVETGYVTMTAGIYAGLQQQALRLRMRWLGDLIIVAGVPLLSQSLDWLTHRLSGPPVAVRATIAVSIFALISAMFHLHVMRNGVFLSGQGRSLFHDFQRIPRLIAAFVARPVVVAVAMLSRAVRTAESEAAV